MSALISIDNNLEQFLEDWDMAYGQKVNSIPLFNLEKVINWSIKQRQHFIKTFYHVRGHFHNFLWYMGNFAPNKAGKNMVLKNIIDELGENALSHEQLYHLFSEQVGVNILNEMIEEETYLPFIKEFNRGYIRWMHNQDWPTKVSTFAALERLDNTDYANAKKLAETLGVKGSGLTFFNVHMNSKHFDSVLLDAFNEVWESHPEKAKTAFEFVANHQTTMWRDLSDEIFAYS